MSGDAIWAEYRQIIADGIANTDRSLQLRIGPSEIGIPCDRCLARKLAGIPELRGEDWLPAVGSAVHADLAAIFRRHNRTQPFDRFLVETGVEVGTILGQPISGHADLFDTEILRLTDWKIVGAARLKAVKAHGPAVEYRRQVHLYGRGFTYAGWPVREVAIAYLPRNAATLSDAQIWVEDYDETVATSALDRAERIARDLLTVIRVGSMPDRLDEYIAGLPALEGDCYSCSRYPRPDGTLPLPPGHWERKPFAGIIG